MTKSGLNSSICCWVCSVSWFGVLRFSLFFVCLIRFVQVVWVFFVLLANLVHFFFGFVFGLFSGQTKFLGWFMIEPKIQATQTSRLSRVELKKKLYRIWFCHFLTKVFCLKVVFGKQALGLFWLVMLQFLFFYQTKPNKIYKIFLLFFKRPKILNLFWASFYKEN